RQPSQGDSSIKTLRNWAVGFERNKRAHIFKKYSGQWRQQSLLQDLTEDGARLLQKFAEAAGFLSKEQGIKLYRETHSALEAKQIHRQRLQPAVSRLRTILRNAIGVERGIQLFSWDKNVKGWRADIEIGFAILEDGHVHLKTVDQLTTEERLDYK